MEVVVNKENIEIVSTISQNEKTQVYLAMNSKKEFVILKIIQGEDRRQLYSRIQEISSKYFPQIFEIEYKDSNTLVLEEYISGSLLDKVLSDNISKKHAIRYMEELIEAVSAIHSLNPPIIHRDIKPENIIITNDNSLKLLDFDAVREYREEEKNQDTRILGTRGYAAPEQYGFSQTDERSDIYSIGIVCREIANKTDLKKSVRKELDKVLDQASMFDPQKRYKDTKSLLKALHKAINAPIRKIAVLSTAFLLTIILFVAVLFVLNKEANTAKESNAKLFESVSLFDDMSISNADLPFSLQDGYDGFDILPDDYSFVPIAYECQVLSELSPQTETEYTFCFYKSNPQALFFYDQAFEETSILRTQFDRYSSEKDTIIESLKLTTGDNMKMEYGFFFVSADYFLKLRPGFYVLDIECASGLTLQFVIDVFDYDVRNARNDPSIASRIQYFSKSRQNRVFYNLLGISSSIKEISVNGITLSEGDFVFTKDERGIILGEEFLSQFDLYDELTVLVTLRNGLQAQAMLTIIP